MKQIGIRYLGFRITHLYYKLSAVMKLRNTLLCIMITNTTELG